MIERVITEASKIPTEYWVVLIDKTLDLVIGKLPTGKNKLKELIRGHLKNYLNAYSNRYLTTKTLLRRDTPVPFYDVFYPLKLQKKSGSDIIDTSDIANLFINSRYLTIIAGAGSGKSTLTKHLFLDCIQREFGIPVRIELSRLNQDDKHSLEAIITKEVFNNELAQNDSTFKKTLEEGKYVFFLDGFDELSKGNSHKISGELDSFVNRFPKNYFILTSRPYANVEMLPQFSNYELLPLDKKDIEKFIRMLMKDDEDVDEIIDALNEIDDYSYIESYLTNPLLLTIFIVTFKNDPSLPENMSVFYERAVNMLLSEHDKEGKINLERVYESGLSLDQFENILRMFSHISYNQGMVTFGEEDIKKVFDIYIKKKCDFPFENRAVINDLLLAAPFWIKDGSVLTFVHRSFQEYFAALFVSSMGNEKNRKFYLSTLTKLNQKNQNPHFEDIDINFLVLCKELDKDRFQVYFQLELLKTIKSELGNIQNINLINYIKIFTNSRKRVNIYTHKTLFGFYERDVVLNPKWIISVLSELDDFYDEIHDENIHFLCKFFADYRRLEIETQADNYIEINSDILSDITERCYAEIQPMARGYLEFIDNSIHRIEVIKSKLQAKQQSDDELWEIM